MKDLRRKYGDDLAEVIAFHAERSDGSTSWRATSHGPPSSTHERHLALADELRRGQGRRAARRQRGTEVGARPCNGCASWRCRTPRSRSQVGEHDADDPGDHVAFLLAANPGSPLLPLTRVASGGELARAMLALRLGADRRGDAGPTLVFDEVDAGIGGTAAIAVGAALAELGADARCWS